MDEDENSYWLNIFFFTFKFAVNIKGKDEIQSDHAYDTLKSELSGVIHLRNVCHEGMLAVASSPNDNMSTVERSHRDNEFNEVIICKYYLRECMLGYLHGNLLHVVLKDKTISYSATLRRTAVSDREIRNKAKKKKKKKGSSQKPARFAMWNPS